jgi:hypothetical protein
VPGRDIVLHLKSVILFYRYTHAAINGDGTLARFSHHERINIKFGYSFKVCHELRKAEEGVDDGGNIGRPLAPELRISRIISFASDVVMGATRKVTSFKTST